MDIEAIKRFKIKSEPEDPTQEPIYTEAPIGAEQYFVSGSRGSGVHNLEEELWLEGGQYSGTDFMNDTQLVTTNVTYDKTTDEATMGSEVVSYLWVHNIGKNYIYEDTNYNVVKKFYLENDFYPSLNTYTGNVTYLDSTLTVPTLEVYQLSEDPVVKIMTIDGTEQVVVLKETVDISKTEDSTTADVLHKLVIRIARVTYSEDLSIWEQYWIVQNYAKNALAGGGTYFGTEPTFELSLDEVESIVWYEGETAPTLAGPYNVTLTTPLENSIVIPEPIDPGIVIPVNP